MAGPEAITEEFSRKLTTVTDSFVAALVLDSPDIDPLADRFDIILDIGDFIKDVGVPTGREICSPALKKLTANLAIPGTDESKLADMESGLPGVLSGNLLSSFITEVVVDLGYYAETQALVAEAARHTGLPIDQLIEIPEKFYESHRDYIEGDPDSKDAAVSFLQLIATAQSELPDSPQKVDRVVAVSVTAINLMLKEARLGNTERYSHLEQLLQLMGASIQNDDLRASVAAQLSKGIGLEAAVLEAQTLLHGHSLVTGADSPLNG